MTFEHAHLVPRLVDASLFVKLLLGRDARGMEVAAVPGVVPGLGTVGQRQLQGFDRDDVGLAQALGDLRVVTMAAAAPSETPQQSNRPSGSAMSGALMA
ncbi:MAG: hypothetical protein R3E86_18095 [Pseudomonadales bacterium]